MPDWYLWRDLNPQHPDPKSGASSSWATQAYINIKDLVGVAPTVMYLIKSEVPWLLGSQIHMHVGEAGFEPAISCSSWELQL